MDAHPCRREDCGCAADNPLMSASRAARRPLPAPSVWLLAAVLLANAAGPRAQAPESTTGEEAAGVPVAKDTAPAGPAALPEREAVLASAIAEGRYEDGFLTLGEGEGEFFARFEAAEQQPGRGSLLFAPQQGRFVGTDPLVAALLEELPPNGWNVLAVQTPLSAPTASADGDAARDEAARARLLAGLAHLSGRGVPIVVAGAGHGAALAASCLGEAAPTGVTGFAAIGPWAAPLPAVPAGLVEIVGTLDDEALALAERRARDARQAERPVPETLLIPGAGARFEHFEDAVARRLRGWMKRVQEDQGLAAAVRD